VIIVGSPLAEPDQNGVLDFTYRYNYDKILDAEGNGAANSPWGRPTYETRESLTP
jgi:hypothetical protein